MENNNSIEIRKYINLVESINSKLLSNKDNDFLISESNYYSKKVGLGLNDITPLFTFVQGDLRFLKGGSDFLTNKGVVDAKSFTKLVNNDFKYVDQKLGAFSKDEIKEIRKSFELSILRAPNANKKLIDSVTDQIVQNDVWKNEYKSIGTEVDLVNALKKAKDENGVLKYSDQSAKSLARKHFANKGKKSKPVDPNKPDPDPKPTDPKPDDTWWNNLRKIGWKKAVAALAVAGIGGFLLWYWFKQNNIKDPEIPVKPPIDPNNEWAPCLVKILENKQGRVDKLTSGTLVVKVKNTTYPDGVLFFSDGKVLTNNGKRKGTWKCKGGKVQPIDEQSTGSNLNSDVEKIISYLKGNVINSDMLTNVKNILNTYNKSGKGKQLLSAYKRISGEFLENTLQSKTTLNDPSERKIRNEIYTIIRSVKGSGGTSTGDPLSGIEIIWDDNKKKDEEDPIIPKPIKKDKYVNCPNFPLYFGCKGPLVSELQTCLKMTGVDGKLGPNTKATAESWGKSNNIELKEGFPGGGGRFAVTEENFKKICGGKPVPVPIKPKEDPIIPTPVKPEDPEPVKPKEDPVIPTPVNTEDLGKKLYDRLRAERSLIYKEGMFGGGDRKAVYRGGELSEDEEKLLIGYMGTINYSLSRENEDYSKGDKLVFKKIRRKQ
jgi:hypothetical protein